MGDCGVFSSTLPLIRYFENIIIPVADFVVAHPGGPFNILELTEILLGADNSQLITSELCSMKR
jgi:hypothetical protein